MKSQKRHHWFVKAQQDLSILTLFRGLKLSVTFDELIRTKFKKNSKYVSEPAEKIISSAPINIGPQIILTSLLILSDVVTEQTPSEVCWKNNMSITAVTCHESEEQGVPNTPLNLCGVTQPITMHKSSGASLQFFLQAWQDSSRALLWQCFRHTYQMPYTSPGSSLTLAEKPYFVLENSKINVFNVLRFSSIFFVV